MQIDAPIAFIDEFALKLLDVTAVCTSPYGICHKQTTLKMLNGEVRFDELATSFLKRWLDQHHPAWSNLAITLPNLANKSTCLGWNEETLLIVRVFQVIRLDDPDVISVLQMLRIRRSMFEKLTSFCASHATVI